MHTRFLALMLASVMIPALAIAPAVAEDAPEAKVEAAATSKDYVVAKFKGGEVKRSELDALWQQMAQGNPDAPKYDELDANTKRELLRNIVRERLVLEKAYAANIDKTEEVKQQMEFIKRKLIGQAYLKSILDTILPESDIKKEYNALAEKFKGKQEIHARHILVETEEEAKEIAKQLKDGGDFAAMAKEKSADKGSGMNGGDLGFFTKESMVPEFAEAAFKMKKGETSAPVKTDFGWHIIRVEDKRDLKAPAYNDVKENIKNKLAGVAVEKYMNRLADGASLEFFNADGSAIKAEEKKEEAVPAAEAPADAKEKAE